MANQKENKYDGHPYATITCPLCGHTDNCWDCSVKCTNDSSGEGTFTCNGCGWRYSYPEVLELESETEEKISTLKRMSCYFGDNSSFDYFSELLREADIATDSLVVFKEPEGRRYTLLVSDLPYMGNKSAGEDKIIALLK